MKKITAGIEHHVERIIFSNIKMVHKFVGRSSIVLRYGGFKLSDIEFKSFI